MWGGVFVCVEYVKPTTSQSSGKGGFVCVEYVKPATAKCSGEGLSVYVGGWG